MVPKSTFYGRFLAGITFIVVIDVHKNTLPDLLFLKLFVVMPMTNNYKNDINEGNFYFMRCFTKFCKNKNKQKFFSLLLRFRLKHE